VTYTPTNQAVGSSRRRAQRGQADEREAHLSERANKAMPSEIVDYLSKNFRNDIFRLLMPRRSAIAKANLV
jgi:hypothetical protein